MQWRAWFVVVLEVGCGSVKPSSPADASSNVDAPGQAVDAVAPPCDLTKPFGTAVQVPGLHDTTGNDTHATLPADELTVYFASDRGSTTNTVWHIYSATRPSRSDPFGTPTVLPGSFTSQGESHPSVSPDGNTIYFDSFRVTTGTVHIFTAKRSSAAVQFPTATMITGDYLIDPAITADGNVLYAANLSTGGLVRMDRTGNGFGTPQDVALQANNAIVSPVTNDDLTMYLAFGDTVGASIGVTKRASTSTGFAAPTGVGELANGSAVAEPSWLSADGCRLYVTYQISGKTTIYVATRP